MGCSDDTFSIFVQVVAPFKIPTVSFPHVEKSATSRLHVEVTTMRTAAKTHRPFDSFEGVRGAAPAAHSDASGDTRGTASDFVGAAASDSAGATASNFAGAEVSDLSDIDIKKVREAAHLRISTAAPDSSDSKKRIAARGVRGLRRAVDQLRINVHEVGNFGGAGSNGSSLYGSAGSSLYQNRISA